MFKVLGAYVIDVLLKTLIVAMAISFTVTKAQPVNHWFKTIGGGDDESFGIAVSPGGYIS